MRVQRQTPWKTAVRRLAAARLISITGGRPPTPRSCTRLRAHGLGDVAVGDAAAHVRRRGVIRAARRRARRPVRPQEGHGRRRTSRAPRTSARWRSCTTRRWLLGVAFWLGDRRAAVLVGLGRGDPEPRGRGAPRVGERPGRARAEHRHHGRPSGRRRARAAIGPGLGVRAERGLVRGLGRAGVERRGRFAEGSARTRRAQGLGRGSCSSRGTGCCGRSCSPGRRSCSGWASYGRRRPARRALRRRRHRLRPHDRDVRRGLVRRVVRRAEAATRRRSPGRCSSAWRSSRSRPARSRSRRGSRRSS